MTGGSTVSLVSLLKGCQPVFILSRYVDNREGFFSFLGFDLVLGSFTQLICVDLTFSSPISL